MLSESHHRRMGEFYKEWQGKLEAVDFDTLPQAGRVDYLLLRHRLEYRKKSLATDWRKLGEITELVGFKDGVLQLYRNYRQRQKLDPRESAEKLAEIAEAVAELKGKVSVEEGDNKLVTTPVLALRAQKVLAELQRRLDGWYKFYAGFDPEFSWWAKQPYGELKEGLEACQA